MGQKIVRPYPFRLERSLALSTKGLNPLLIVSMPAPFRARQSAPKLFPLFSFFLSFVFPWFVPLLLN